VVHKEETVFDAIRKKKLKLKLFGHVCRMPEDRFPKTLTLEMAEVGNE